MNQTSALAPSLSLSALQLSSCAPRTIFFLPSDCSSASCILESTSKRSVLNPTHRWKKHPGGVDNTSLNRAVNPNYKMFSRRKPWEQRQTFSPHPGACLQIHGGPRGRADSGSQSTAVNYPHCGRGLVRCNLEPSGSQWSSWNRTHAPVAARWASKARVKRHSFKSEI